MENLERKLKTLPTPLVKLENPLLENHKISLYVKRIDLIHPHISGNKWFKLFYNLIEARNLGKDTLLTFGGAYSNHIYATAAAGKEYGFKTIGIIRGEEHFPLNPTLKFAKDCGMKIHYVSRALYRNKKSVAYITELQNSFGDFYLLPEGGTNSLALKGCSDIIRSLEIDFDYICTPCGTGGTLAGLIYGLKGRCRAIGFSVLKRGEFLINDVKNLLCNNNISRYNNWEIKFDYHFGGYAKITTELIEFVKEFEKDFGIPIEPIYTGKMLFGIFDMVKSNYFERDSTIIALHTGGMQGLNGLKNKIDKLVTFS